MKPEPIREFFECTFPGAREVMFVCFHPGHKWHGWLFRRHVDGQLVSVRKMLPFHPAVEWIF